MNQEESIPATRRYRTLTTHTPASVRAPGHRLDWSNKPALYRSYPGAPTVPLPAPARLGAPALAAIANPAAPPPARVELDAATLGTLLFLSGGITGARPSGGDIRATAAAGALYPNELYVVAGGVTGLDAGVYHFDPKGFRLHQLRAGDWRPHLGAAAADACIRDAPATVVLSGILWRSAWKYRERAYRHLYWDGGMMLAHLLAAAAATEVPAEILAVFADSPVDRLVGADGSREMTLALAPLGCTARLERSPAPAAPAPEPPALPRVATALSRKVVDHPEAARYHAASRLASADAAPTLRAATLPRRPRAGSSMVPLPPPAAARGDASLDAVVRRRRSPRRFARARIAAAELAAVLERPSRGLVADFLRRQPSVLETYVIVNAVEGLDPGAYHYRPEEHRLERVSGGDFRRTAGFLCLEQPLAHDASAVLFYLADLEATGRVFGERGYRFAELEAGVLAGRAYLAAEAVGRGATGLTFYDDEVIRFFSPHANGLEALLVVAVGVPARHRG
jgi:SagB-type dehydrogenase family enzyme